MTRRLFLTACLALGLSALSPPPPPVVLGQDLPVRLADRDFWRMAVDMSEPDGYFRSDNLTSNELWFQRVIPELVRRTRPGRAYLGVGPEQNFTYMAAVRPRLALIVDIRRGNLLVQLMYKALFELAKDRADFVSMLFSKPRPAGLGADSTATDLFEKFGAVTGNDALYARNFKAIQDQLTRRHSLPLSPRDLEGLEYAYRSFYSRGFAVRFSPTYADLMTEVDNEGASRSYLATEANFTFLKELESRNLVVPVIGDFGGPKAIRAVGAYLKAHGVLVGAFYLSNVEQYLVQDGKWTTFCQSVATLPLDGSSIFIRTSGGRGVGFGSAFITSLHPILDDVKNCE